MIDFMFSYIVQCLTDKIIKAHTCIWTNVKLMFEDMYV